MIRFIALAGLFLSLLISVDAQSGREGFITSGDGVRLFYKVVGSGTDVVVAVHGGPGNSMESILPDLEPLARKRTVIYYDQRGNGRSDLIKDYKKLAIAYHVTDLETVRKHFKLDKMILLGNSWGGLLISYYAAAHPDRIERMILHNPAPPTMGFLNEMADEVGARVGSRYRGEQAKRYKVVANPANWRKAPDARSMCREWLTMLLVTYVYDAKTFERVKGDMCSGSVEAVREQQYANAKIWASLGDFNLLPSITSVAAPVLVIHGEVDPIPVGSSEAWVAAYPNSRLLLIKESGHISHVEKPDIFFPAVETFLRGTFPAGAMKANVPNVK
ncbi:MAG: alpha/beta hydrolase [Pyrinomonadaceae bacterium]